MAVPKKKISKSSGRSRRSHYKVKAPGLARCSNCKSYIAAHHVCGVCGHFKGKQVVAVA
jgi:large subunit ribosomal protein L32